LEHIDDVRRQRHDTFFVTFAEDAKLSIGKGKIFELQLKNFARAQAIEKH
jgi:hypothetical protein